MDVPNAKVNFKQGRSKAKKNKKIKKLRKTYKRIIPNGGKQKTGERSYISVDRKELQQK